MRITICGGGSLGHVCAGVLSSHPANEVNILTGHPQQWQHHVTVDDPEGRIIQGNIQTITSSAQETIPHSDIVLLCVPGPLIEPILNDLRPHLTERNKVGAIVSSTGFFFKAHRILPSGTQLFGFQRVPYISRIQEYGSSAHLLGYKKALSAATENIAHPEEFCELLSELFLTPVTLLNNYYEASLTNSNPILHTGRLFTMWGNYRGESYDHNIYFYKEWDTASAQKIIDMDREFMQLLQTLPVAPGAIPSLLEYYESTDAESLAEKIRSIPAFQPILSPMRETSSGWVPDFSSRYFTEDFPHGLQIIKDLAVEHKIKTPVIDEVLGWGLAAIKTF